MHGLIFMTWEKYLGDRFGKRFLDAYRNAIGETAANLPLANRLYDDETLLVGVGAASRLASMLPEALLREYGRYFIINGLTGHLCLYILAQVHNGCDLLLTMRNAHARLRTTLEGLQPPLFEYEPSSLPNEVILRYDSPRKLCDVLLGAIEGAAERFGETVQIQEHACMKTGAPFCRISARFFAPKDDPDRYRRPRPIRASSAFMPRCLIWSGTPCLMLADRRGSGYQNYKERCNGAIVSLRTTSAQQYYLRHCTSCNSQATS